MNIREDVIYARQSVDRKDSISIESQIDFCKYELKGGSCRVFKDKVNNPVPVSLLSGDRKPQIRFLGNHHSGSGNLYHKSFRM